MGFGVKGLGFRVECVFLLGTSIFGPEGWEVRAGGWGDIRRKGLASTLPNP